MVWTPSAVGSLARPKRASRVMRMRPLYTIQSLRCFLEAQITVPFMQRRSRWAPVFEIGRVAGGATAGLDDIEEAGIDFEGFGVAGELGASDSVGEEVEAREGLALTEGPSLELTAVGFAGISGALEVAAGENCLGLGE